MAKQRKEAKAAKAAKEAKGVKAAKAGKDKKPGARTLGLGFSPCPNDTFMFHALVTGKIEVEDVAFVPELLDIQELNQRALGSRDGQGERKGKARGTGSGQGTQHTERPLGQQVRPLVVTKLSIPALAHLTDDYTALSAGAALGVGCGPLVVRNVYRGDIAVLEDLEGLQVAVPGKHTTAALLLMIFGPGDVRPVPMPFHQIMTAVAAGEVDAGVVIHEGRFTYKDHGLLLVEDLGEIWEKASGLPLPLGVVAARRDLGKDLIGRIEDGVRGSVEHALSHPGDGWDYIRKHAQELSEDVCRRHIDLYVNDYSKDLGKTGRKAIEELIKRGRAAIKIPRRSSPWR
ncbi:MAG: menaquinone biosynthesis family protein [Planctomycetota bacterium]|jgi:1,4-dihydroxy-6-naphthoate synthase